MKNTSFKVEDVFGDVICKENFSRKQIPKLNPFFSQNNVNINIKIKFNFFKSRKKKNVDFEPSDPTYYEKQFLVI